MDITLAQIRLKCGDFEFNYNSIKDAVNNADTDIIIFSSVDIADLGGKDLVLDEKVRQAQGELYEKIAAEFTHKKIFLGEIFISDGEISISEDGFYNIDGKKIYVSDSFESKIECDIYILAHNRYFTVDTYQDFVENIYTESDFIYVNAVAMADENIYAGLSFAKNAKNELVFQAPLCENSINRIDFTSAADFLYEPVESQIMKVTSFALKEYCENTGFKKVVLGLSGGIDSALTAVLAVNALGKDNVLGILMPSMFSSDSSVTDALALAKNLGIETVKEPITPLFDAFMQGRERKHDLAEENLQARLRALILMFYSNRENMLLLSTGNKSESAMGFGTLYGDLAGGLNLICDLTKMNVYKVANYINRSREIIPQNTIDKTPSAELHPGQKDCDRLPEYEILDDIIEMYVEENIPHEKIYAKYDKVLVDDTIKKIYRAQFKRKQGCIGVRLTERSFNNGVNLPVAQKFY